MATDLEDPPVQTTASLVGGILGDLQRLVEQQFELTRQEIQEELRLRIAAGILFAAGIGLIFLGAIESCLGLAHLLHWAASPAGTETAWLPLWGCHAVVAAVFAVIGGVLVQVGRARFASVQSFHNPLTEIMQEHSA